MRFCPSCGAEVERGVPAGDDRAAPCLPGLRRRSTTTTPRSWSAASARWATGCCCAGARSSPGAGFWTIPAGYLELGESAEAGALREAWEEARARIELEGLLAVYSVERIGQVQLLYRARLLRRGGGGRSGEPGGAAAGLGRDPLGGPRLPDRPLDPASMPGPCAARRAPWSRWAIPAAGQPEPVPGEAGL